jgi:hypothetical protein
VSTLLAHLPQGSRFTLWTTGDRPTKLTELGDDVGAATQALRRTVGSASFSNSISRAFPSGVAWMALFVALTGTSVAATHYLITSTTQISR